MRKTWNVIGRVWAPRCGTVCGLLAMNQGNETPSDLTPTPPRRDIEAPEPGAARTESRSMSFRQYFGGPMPPPDVLAGYDKALPGAADRIVALAEGEAAHRQQMDRQHIEAFIADAHEDRAQQTRGQYLGFAIAVIGIVAAVVVIVATDSWPGTASAAVLGGAPLVTLVGLFLRGHHNGETEEPQPAQQEDDEEAEPPVP